MAVWTNGGQISCYHRKDPNYFEDITDIPSSGQSLQDILTERFTLRDLIIKDKIANERKSLKDIILDMENEVLANAGVDVFEEVFKLIFTKLYDEYLSRKDKTKISFYLEQQLTDAERGDYLKLKQCLADLKDDKFRVMDFRNSGQTDSELNAMPGGSLTILKGRTALPMNSFFRKAEAIQGRISLFSRQNSHTAAWKMISGNATAEGWKALSRSL